MKLRNNIYPLQLIEPGEVFYFVGDRKKITYVLNYVKPFETKRQAGFLINYANCRLVNPTYGNLQVEPHKAKRYVIYLRNINDKTPYYYD